MGRKQKMVFQPGQPAKDAELIEVSHATENWSTYELADGSQLKVRPVLAEVWRLDNEYDADGNPAYVAKIVQTINVIAPDKLRKLPKGS